MRFIAALITTLIAALITGLLLVPTPALGQSADAVAPSGLSGELRRDDPDALIALQLSLAGIYVQAGLRAEAVAAYEQALMSILQFRGQGHLSMADPMTAVGRLASDPLVALRWLETAQTVRAAHWGADDPRLIPFAREIEAARAAMP